MKKFRKVLDGLTTSSPGATVGSPSCGSAAGTPTAAPTPKEIDVQETLVSENFQLCKVGWWRRLFRLHPSEHVTCEVLQAGRCRRLWALGCGWKLNLLLAVRGSAPRTAPALSGLRVYPRTVRVFVCARACSRVCSTVSGRSKLCTCAAGSWEKVGEQQRPRCVEWERWHNRWASLS